MIRGALDAGDVNGPFPGGADGSGGLADVCELLEVCRALYSGDIKERLGPAVDRVDRLMRDHGAGVAAAQTLASLGAQLVDASPPVLIGVGERVERCRNEARLAWDGLPGALAVLEAHHRRLAKQLARSRRLAL